MKILICGGRGFIGNAIGARLEAQGHIVVRGVRQPRSDNDISVDFTRDLRPEDWLPRLAGMDAVINTVGILVEREGQSFAAVHRDAPIALFRACAMVGVRRVIQISALGADMGDTPYFDTKRAADTFLMQQDLEWQVVRPALVYGNDGDSATFFRTLASLPLLGLPAGGHQWVQPVHIDDLAEAVIALALAATPVRQCIDIVGAARVEYRDMLAAYRESMGFAPALTIAIPSPLIGAAARLGNYLPGSILTSDTWKMLQDGNTGDVAATATLLGRMPRGVQNFILPCDTAVLREQALAQWRTLLMRVALALVWLLTGVVSLFVYPVNDSLALLAPVGLTGTPALLALYGAAMLDLAFGIATLVRPGRRLWLLQGATIVAYTLIILIALPEYLAHPFGPVIKNLPILALLFVLLAEEQRRDV